MRDPIDVLKIVELIFDNPCKFFLISVQYEEPIFYFNQRDGLTSDYISVMDLPFLVTAQGRIQ